jgi:GNAT superfamily N-acetyltransferase
MVGRMPNVRRATAQDAAELVRLREMLLLAMGQDVEESNWRTQALAQFEQRIAPGGDLTGFVIDGDNGELAASAVGLVVTSLPGPNRPDGRTGYLLNLATDPKYRRQGNARAVVTALLDWFHGQGVKRIELHANERGEMLYAQLGFTEHTTKALTYAERRPL